MSSISLRRRIRHSRGALALGLIVGLGVLLALHHSDLMPMDHGQSGGTSVEMTGAMICLGVLAAGLALCPEIGAMLQWRRPERSGSHFLRHLTGPPAPVPAARAGPALSQVFRL